MNGTKYTDDDFGEVAWESEPCTWIGSFNIGANPAELRIAGSRRFMEVSDSARETFLRLRSSEIAAREYASGKLLRLYNEDWSSAPPIDDHTFAQRMTLEAVAIHEDGSATFSYRDGDLFAGHYIIVRADQNGDFLDANLCG